MNKTAVLLATLLITFCVGTAQIVLSFASLTPTRTIATSGTIEPVRRVVYHGIALPAHQASIWTVYTDADYARFASWGLNSVLYNIWWTHYWEADELNPGGYNEAWLTGLETQVALALAHGLKPLLCSHVSFAKDGAYGWADTTQRGPDYVNLNEQDASGSYGRDRYCNWLRMLAQRFPECGIDPWGFPYHASWSLLQNQPDKEITFYNVTQRAFLQAIRSVSNQTIILNPLQQGVYHVPYKLQTGQFINPNFRTHDDYSNILYGTNTHDAAGHNGSPSYNQIASLGAEWDYDLDWMKHQMQPAVDLAKTHDVVCVENIALIIHGGLSERPILQSRLDWMEELLKIEQNAGISWFHHRYENPPGVQSPIETDGSDTAVAQLIAEYASHP